MNIDPQGPMSLIVVQLVASPPFPYGSATPSIRAIINVYGSWYLVWRRLIILAPNNDCCVLDTRNEVVALE
jgi:hypothetical protein